MKIEIIAAGRLRSGPYFDGISEYQKRLNWDISLTEIISKEKDAKRIHNDETQQILSKIRSDAHVIALDERGKNIKSLSWADHIKRQQNQSTPCIQFILGGADGLDPKIRERANLLLSFGALTWPHMLARLMLFEQLYRSQQILSGHPYHRE